MYNIQNARNGYLSNYKGIKQLEQEDVDDEQKKRKKE